jgi:hypothetical protein
MEGVLAISSRGDERDEVVDGVGRRMEGMRELNVLVDQLKNETKLSVKRSLFIQAKKRRKKSTAEERKKQQIT